MALAGPYRGLTLDQALRELKRDGLSVLYSSDLVKPWMRVQAEPQSRELRAILAEISAPYDLAVSEGPRGYLMLVRSATAAQPSEPTAEASPARVLPPREDLAEVVVTASHYELLREPDLSLTSFSAGDLELMPDVGDDPLRAVGRLPGTATSDVSAKAHLRGGQGDETLVLFDGLRLYEPYHFKDFHSLFSTIDPSVIDGVRIYTGGFPVVYGDRMSGVIDIAPLQLEKPLHREISLSLFNASALAAGRFGDGERDWLLSARRGLPDVIIDIVDPTIGRPHYVDVHGRVRSRVTDALSIAASALAFREELSLSDSDQEERAQAEYDDRYYWLRFDYAASGALAGNLLLARTELSSLRSGELDQEGVSRGALQDRREFAIDSLQTDWSWRLTPRLLGQVGAELRRGEGSYDYADQVEFALLFDSPGASREPQRTRNLSVRPQGEQYGAYANLRIAPLESLTFDAGLRWDKETFSAVNEAQVSPRLGVRYRPRPNTELRTSWGRYFQGQAINELQISDGMDEFQAAQSSDHLVASLDYHHVSGVDVRLEAYRKEYRELRPRFENLLNTLVLLPELKPDRVRIDPVSATATGAELTLRRSAPEAVSWWASYTWATVEDDDAQIEARRTWDQTHFLSAGIAWRGQYWDASLAGSYHSGRPTTAVELDAAAVPLPLVVAGPRNAERLDSYFSIDGRIARRFEFEGAGELTVFLEARNLTNRRNDCCIEYEIADPEEGAGLELETLDTVPFFPSIGFNWQF